MEMAARCCCHKIHKTRNGKRLRRETEIASQCFDSRKYFWGSGQSIEAARTALGAVITYCRLELGKELGPTITTAHNMMIYYYPFGDCVVQFWTREGALISLNISMAISLNLKSFTTHSRPDSKKDIGSL